MAIVSDDGVYHIEVNMVMNEPGTFDGLFPMSGMSHFAKVSLRCAGRYLCGSGMDDAFIESVWIQDTFHCVIWRSLRFVLRKHAYCIRSPRLSHVECLLFTDIFVWDMLL